MRSFTLGLLAAAMALSVGCTNSSKVGVSPSTSASANPTAFPDASATTEAKWTTFKAPGDAFVVETPMPLSEVKNQGKMKRFRTPDVTGHVIYDIGYVDIDPRDANVPRSRLVKSLAIGLTKNLKVEYEQQGLFLKQYPSDMLRFYNPKKEQVLAQIFAGQKRVYLMEVIIPSTYNNINQVPAHKFMLSMKPNDEAPPPETLDGPSGMPSGHPAVKENDEPQGSLDEPDSTPSGAPAVKGSGAPDETQEGPAGMPPGHPAVKGGGAPGPQGGASNTPHK